MKDDDVWCPCCQRQIAAVQDDGTVAIYPWRHEPWCPDLDDAERWEITMGGAL